MTSSATVTFRNALVALLAAVCAVAILASGDARAAITHPYTGVSFGPGGVGSGGFGEVVGVAVDSRNGDVFVLDVAEGGRLYKFNSAGEPVDFSGLGSNEIEGVGSASRKEEQVAVDSSTGPDAGDIYIANNRGVRIYGENGSYLGELSGGEMCGVAVDPSGNVYVGIYYETVERFTPSANPVTNSDVSGTMGGLRAVCNVGVDGAGDIFADSYGGGVYEYEALQFGSLSASGTLLDPSALTLTVDQPSDQVYVDSGSVITQYDAAVQPAATMGTSGGSGAGALSGSFGVAVNHETGELYAGDGAQVEIFGGRVAVTSAETEAAGSLTSSQAVLHGVVEPAGAEVTACEFEYGQSSLDHKVPCEPGPPYAEPSAQVSAAAGGLQPGTAYQYRIIGVTSRGTFTGKSVTFTTKGPQIKGETSEGVGINAATLSARIVVGAEPTVHYHVEYGASASYEKSTSLVEVEGEEASAKVLVSGLRSNTTYHFRFVAENTTATSYGPDLTFTTEAVVSEESFSQVTTEAAVVSAQIDTGGLQTSYVVEYGANSSYGSSTAPVDVGAGERSVAATIRLSGLQAGADYHFRFVASNENEVYPAEDLSFTTHALSTLGLPDKRGYEMVTPTDNEGAEPYVPLDGGFRGEEDAIFSEYPFAAAVDGNAVTYLGSPTSSGNGSQGGGEGNQYLARRDADGAWIQTDIQPAGYTSPRYWSFSSDLKHAVLSSEERIEDAGLQGYQGLFARDEANSSYAPLFSVTPPNRPPGRFGAAMPSGELSQTGLGAFYAGASADFTHLLFEANDALTNEAVDPEREYNNLYESVGGQLRSVNVLPDGTAAPNASFGVAMHTDASPVNFSHVISSDGSRIFWTDMNTNDLYVREDGLRTTLVAESATYLTASSDGSRVIYGKGGDLYEDDLQAGVTTDLEPGAEMTGILGASEDLSYIYLVAQGVLASGGEAEQNNLYLLHNGHTRYVATLGAGEELVDAEIYPQNGRSSSDLPWQPDIGRRTAEVTPSGRDVVFMSTASLTGYDNREPTGSAVVEVYVYDAENGALSCASCDRTGERPTAVGQYTAGGILPISAYPTYQLHVISDDGGRVFFESREPLLPEATDQKLNVYEWERDGSGSCQDASGCIYLLSTGSSSTSSYFIDASASGNDVFLMTRSALVEADNNEYNDIYDAHVGAMESAASPRCTGTGCQGVPAAPPIFATPSSVTYSGVGNFAAPVAKTKPKARRAPKSKANKRCAAKRATHARRSTGKKRVKAMGCLHKKSGRRPNKKVKKGSAR